MGIGDWLHLATWVVGGIGSVGVTFLGFLIRAVVKQTIATNQLTTELKQHRTEYAATVIKVDDHDRRIGEHDVTLGRHSERLDDHERRLGGKR